MIIVNFKLKYLIFFCAIGLLFYPTIVEAQRQEIYFSHLTVKDGLSQSSANCIIQDFRGFIWISTNNGLNRYDGSTFKIYKFDPKNSNSISDNSTDNILEDKKKKLWVCTNGKGLNLYDRNNDSWIKFNSIPSDANTLSSDNISSIVEDIIPGNLWISTYNGLNYYDDSLKTFQRFLAGNLSIKYRGKRVKGSLYNNEITCIFKAKNENDLWIGYKNKISRFLRKENHFETFDLYINNQKLSSTATVTTIFKDSKNKLWAGTEGYGLFEFDQKAKVFRNSTNMGTQIGRYSVKTLFEDNQNKLWIGYNGYGLGCYDVKSGLYSHYFENQNLSYALNNNTVYSIFQSKDGILWFGTFGDGINVIDKNRYKFQLYKSIPNERNSLSNNHVREICEGDNGIIWIGTRKGVDLFNSKTKQISQYQFPNGVGSVINNDIVLSIVKDENKSIWIGTFSNGLFCYNPKTRNTLQYIPKTDDKNSISDQHIYKLFFDSNKNLWAGTLNGLNVKLKGSNNFIRYTLFGIVDIAEDKKGNIFIGSSHGLYTIKPGQKTPVKIWPANSIDGVNCVYFDKNDEMWIGTRTNGLINFASNYKIKNQYTTHNGLSENKVYGILDDEIGNLWLSTDHGLSMFERKKSLFKNFDENDGLQSNEFYSNSYLKATDGMMYFGGFNGFNTFDPKNIVVNKCIPNIVFTNFMLFNKEVQIGEDKSPLKQSITECSEIELSYSQNVFSIDFASLNFTSPNKNQYAYFLEGFDKEENGWNYIGQKHSVTFTNLPPGKYKLKVKGSNNDLKWNEKGSELSIRVNPPFWKTWQAGLLYFIASAGLVFMFMRFTVMRTKLKLDYENEHLEKLRSEENYQMRLSFFTNISHEFRTPLTLILGPIDSIMKNISHDSTIYEPLRLVQRNSKKLFNLVNELLDFRKLEAGKMVLKYQKSNIVAFLREVYDNFIEFSTEKQIQYTFFSEKQELVSWFDPKVIEKILSNLISNAFKYTDDKGEISIMINHIRSEQHKNESKTNELLETLKIIVKDTGKGISESKIPYVFDNFYRNETGAGSQKVGSGIGLSFTKDLVEMIGGRISVESNVGEGTRFYVEIPLIYNPINDSSSKIEFVDSEEVPEIMSKDLQIVENNWIQSNLPQINNEDNTTIILVVDDNKDIRSYIRYNLERKYKIIEADGGQQAIIIAQQVIPDIIICDIMMPDMDGIEVCTTLKNDEHTSHIPVILLTAKSTLDYRIEGYKTGADSYITKPFEPELLEARIYNLLETRSNLQKKFSREITLEPTQTHITSKDELFIQKIMQLLEDNLSNSDFGVTEMVQSLGTSRPVLYRKVKALTNLSLMEFVLQYRMKKAANILSQNQLNISEVAYMVGFDDPKYFGKSFKRHFKMSPSEFVKKQQRNNIEQED